MSMIHDKVRFYELVKFLLLSVILQFASMQVICSLTFGYKF